jgi:predicted GIY-YIG superfamily endonuclease
LTAHMNEMTPLVLTGALRRVGSLFALAGQVEARYAKAKAHVDKLTQSILAKAFRSELIPQDPNDLPAPRPGTSFVYVLECADGSHYIGHTDDIERRWCDHAAGRGSEWCRRHPPVKLVHWEQFDSREAAVRREKDLKTGFGRKWLKREIAAGRTRQAGEPASVLLERLRAERENLNKTSHQRILLARSTAARTN